jgi:asparagine synthase (glutamine-hydrolysing)
MLAVQRHRGPDGAGMFYEPPVVLGHRRLSILDLSDAAAQPMRDGDDRYVLTYNGEIYNYIELRGVLEQLGVTFRSTGDTEVLLAAFARWGADCLHRLNGMFAFAVYDRWSRELFCARDRLGVKPFVYRWDGRRFAFASEHKALVAARLAGDGVSAEALYEYIARGYTTSGRSFFADLRVLPPGHALVVAPDGGFSSRAWWTPSLTPEPDRSFEAWSDQVGALLQDSVRLRLRSDVPVGAHLSGGLDSSAIVAAAARSGTTDVITFTGAFSNDEESDERTYSREVSAAYGLAAREVLIDVDELAGAFDRLLWHMDEPIAGPGVFPQLAVCDLAARHGVKVVLGGQGGDELFGGYARHRLAYYANVLRTGPLVERTLAAWKLAALVATNWRRARRTATRIGDSDLAPSFIAEIPRELREELRRPLWRSSTAEELLAWDVRNYLPALLQVEDRTSMAASLESRAPLLDYRLVELVLRMPAAHKFNDGVTKAPLRTAVSSWLPERIVMRRDKRGFPTPLHRWRDRPGLRRLIDDVLNDAAGSNGGGDFAVFSPAYLARRERFTANELWTALMIQGWLARRSLGPSRPGAGV